MSKHYVQKPGGGWIEKGHPDAPVEPEVLPDAGALWGDRSYDGLRATDGTPIDTRTKHRAYMKQHGLTTIDDYTDHFAKAAKSREEYFRGVDPDRKRDIARALEKRRG